MPATADEDCEPETSAVLRFVAQRYDEMAHMPAQIDLTNKRYARADLKGCEMADHMNRIAEFRSMADWLRAIAADDPDPKNRATLINIAAMLDQQAGGAEPIDQMMRSIPKR